MAVRRKKKKKVEAPAVFTTRIDETFESNEKEPEFLDKSLQRLLRRARVMGKSFRDVEVESPRDLRFSVNGFQTGIGVKLPGIKNNFGLTPWALSQLGRQMDFPASYFFKLHQRGHDSLLLKNLNELREDSPEERPLVFRTYRDQTFGPTIRGTVTPRYSPTDNTTLLETLIGNHDAARLKVTETQLTPDIMRLRVIDPRVKVQERKGKKPTLYGGLCIENSEVGRRSVSLNAYFWRLVCANGLMLMQDILRWRRRHLGNALEDFGESLTTGLADLQKLGGSLEGTIQRARKQVLKAEALKEFFEKALTLGTGARPLLGLGEREDVLARLTSMAKHETPWTNGRFTRWGAINAITRMAQGLPSDRRLQTEAYAGRLLLAS